MLSMLVQKFQNTIYNSWIAIKYFNITPYTWLEKRVLNIKILPLSVSYSSIEYYICFSNIKVLFLLANYDTQPQTHPCIQMRLQKVADFEAAAMMEDCSKMLHR
jgi:hypothetical protein